MRNGKGRGKNGMDMAEVRAAKRAKTLSRKPAGNIASASTAIVALPSQEEITSFVKVMEEANEEIKATKWGIQAAATLRMIHQKLANAGSFLLRHNDQCQECVCKASFNLMRTAGDGYTREQFAQEPDDLLVQIVDLGCQLLGKYGKASVQVDLHSFVEELETWTETYNTPELQRMLDTAITTLGRIEAKQLEKKAADKAKLAKKKEAAALKKAKEAEEKAKLAAKKAADKEKLAAKKAAEKEKLAAKKEKVAAKKAADKEKLAAKKAAEKAKKAEERSRSAKSEPWGGAVDVRPLKLPRRPR